MSEFLPYPHTPRSDGSPLYNRRARHLRGQTLAAIAATGKPIAEVGGPTFDGFAVLGSEPLPAPLVVTNISKRHGNIDSYADIRNWPFASGSLGAIINASLDRYPSGATLNDDSEKGLGNHPQILNRPYEERLQSDVDRAMLHRSRSHAANNYRSWHNPEIMGRALRFTMLREARRSLTEGGVLVLRNMDEVEMNAAQDLGFAKLGDHGASPVSGYGGERFYQGEFVYQLTDMHTPLASSLEQYGVI
ncbi:MAG TPA: hypothetical protein VLG11_05950 [Candidatus Saccharimonadales bacterium]|nr:hypothetical protein [Candidatus Saccharimonadales bacterium]